MSLKPFVHVRLIPDQICHNYHDVTHYTSRGRILKVSFDASEKGHLVGNIREGGDFVWRTLEGQLTCISGVYSEMLEGDGEKTRTHGSVTAQSDYQG